MTIPGDARVNPSSPAGQIESAGAVALGLTRLTGWRRHVARWAVIALIAAPLGVVIVAQLLR